MAARKLQSEIDRTLKKVSEGVELFESIYEKMQASTNQTQKEKLETDLKTQIKKLQRLRDQIKTWVASNDIKDKSALIENRKLIETQMEKFKACEKEMKTKAFSKEGLTQSAKLDPKQQEKVDTMSWVQNMMDELMVQVESAEAEIENLQGGGKKKKSGGSTTERLETLEGLNERRKWHISRLEIILRLLDNGSLATERVVELQEDVKYFVESNMEEDFEEDSGVYDELNLDEEEEKFRMPIDESESEESEEASEDLPLRTPSKKHDEESVASSNKRESPVLKKATASLQQRKTSIAAEITPKPPPHANFAQQSVASMVKAPAPPRNASGYAKVAAAAVAPAASSQTQSSQSAAQATVVPPTPSASSTTASSSIPPDQRSAIASSPSLTHPSVTSPMLSSAASVSHQPDDSLYSAHGSSPSLLDAVPSSIDGPVTTSSPQRAVARKASLSSPTSLQPPGIPPPSQQESASASHTNGVVSTASAVTARELPTPSPLPTPAHAFPGSSSAAPGVSTGASPLPQSVQQQPQPPQFPPGVSLSSTQATKLAPGANATARPPSVAPSQLPTQIQPQRANAFPGSLSDLVMSFENVKQKAPHRMSNLDQVHKLLQGSYSSMPQPQDTEKPKYYVPRNPVQTPSYYPQSPHPLLNTPGIFSQLDVETLFYVFYYHPGTYQQYLAAKELKRQSWRFHVKYLTWFQRHSEPQAITEEYEQGVYVYFDWEGSWCQRKKSDFRFEYRYLSED
ncbi:Not1 N-terminal domain, CCR4-Not complex component-domain-containing protein [Epithele typhae]|uniref:Not1 N-terminal domain, CCR4-Not complex component-domain-containing protein n=1 Tax=Epithele typhae TaxID=378194 RepID=UPI0020086C18|nr:Not1 N-terminal domain, CCR4-Not complex component-domain-containing protein [Epithele typhae]KAH9943023.1 Not1 N-terminal domain, CCR4-Not complex component-domain-containing protein [Epithele typhae]